MRSLKKFKNQPEIKNRQYLLNFFLIIVLLQVALEAKSQENDSIPFYIEMYRITEAYSVIKTEDSVLVDTINTFVSTETDLFFFYIKHTDSLFFRIQQYDSVILAGLTVNIPNPGFPSVKRDDAKFYTGDIWYYEKYGKGAIMKEYITNSYQENKRMDFFFHISMPFQHQELQLYGYDANPLTQNDPLINAIKRGKMAEKQENGILKSRAGKK